MDFAPILKVNQIPLNDLLIMLLKTCEDTLGSLVEIEFAVTLDRHHGTPARFGFLQVRPMVVSRDEVDVSEADLLGDNVLLASEKVLGNGINDTIRDIVFVKPDSFDVKYTRAIAKELESINNKLVEAKQSYLLIGFGRWGTSDDAAGIPVDFGQISGAKVIVESTLPDLNFNLSQGSHFFHNITSFRISYFSVFHWGKYKIDWQWLNRQKTIAETKHVRHVELQSPLQVKVDGRNGQGVICHD